MQIISPYKDYYDNAVCNLYCTGENKSQVKYIRKQKEIDYNTPREMLYAMQDHPLSGIGLLRGKDDIAYYEIQPIGFCGKIYYPVKIRNQYYYNLDTIFDDYIKTLKTKEEQDRTIKKLKEIPRSHTTSYNILIQKNINYYINKLKQFESIWLNYFVEFKTPIFTFQNKVVNCNYNIIINPILNKLQFYKQFSATETYQEIELFFNSVLTNQENPPQITDSIILLEAKGFDKKTSFRHPTKIKNK